MAVSIFEKDRLSICQLSICRLSICQKIGQVINLSVINLQVVNLQVINNPPTFLGANILGSTIFFFEFSFWRLFFEKKENINLLGMTELNDFFRIELLKTYLNDITVPIFENCKKMLNHSTLLYCALCAVCEQRFRSAKLGHKHTRQNMSPVYCTLW